MLTIIIFSEPRTSLFNTCLCIKFLSIIYQVFLGFNRCVTNFILSRTQKRFISPFSPGLNVTSNLFVVTHDCKLLISGGHWDSSLQVYNIAKSRKLAHICRHIGMASTLYSLLLLWIVITCITFVHCQYSKVRLSGTCL